MQIEDGDEAPIDSTPANGSTPNHSSTTTLSAAESAVNRAVGETSGGFPAVTEKQWRQTWMIIEYADKGSLQVRGVGRGGERSAPTGQGSRAGVRGRALNYQYSFRSDMPVHAIRSPLLHRT